MGQVSYKTLNEALAAAASGPFFPDWEFDTLFGMSRAELSALVGTISHSPPTSQQLIAVGNAVNNLLSYPHGQEAQWSLWLTCTSGELESAYANWRASGHEA